MVLHLFRSLATKKEQTHHLGVSALLRQTVNCTEVVYYAAIYRTIPILPGSHNLATVHFAWCSVFSLRRTIA